MTASRDAGPPPSTTATSHPLPTTPQVPGHASAAVTALLTPVSTQLRRPARSGPSRRRASRYASRNSAPHPASTAPSRPVNPPPRP